MKSSVPHGQYLDCYYSCCILMTCMHKVLTIIKYIAKFANDSNYFKIIKSNLDCLSLQEDLNDLSNWSFVNELRFQPAKCSNLQVTRKLKTHARALIGMLRLKRQICFLPCI